ncbi:putative ataxia telangiectasia mutated [Phaeomoniella chlamydospora]|uniref:Serine/threonine-protein kinase Tel1 n=1 Tax=Phaeomoniella chlamydospora TaxID=158046 RepID=A0A0G2EE39_PHACM|nr:putative ataxia telangiectasia mutated [Phaeomoniella chlamydospora]
MGNLDIESALDRLSSDKSKERLDGLNGLERVLKNIKGRSNVQNINDEGSHRVFEALFRFVRVEKSSFVQSSTSKARTHGPRLSSAASVVRLAVEVANERITTKTVNAIIDHILDSLTAPGSSIFEILVEDYLRALSTLLLYAPHAEHLRTAKWLNLVDFLIDSISSAIEGLDVNPSGTPLGTPQPDSSQFLGRPASLSANGRRENRSASRHSASSTKNTLLCLSALFNHGSHPLMSRSATAGESMLELLLRLPATSESLTIAFSLLNKVLSVVITEDLGLFHRIVLATVKPIQRLWSIKATNLRDQLVITLSYAVELVDSNPLGEDLIAFRHSIHELYAAIFIEYQRRQERDMLQSDELVFEGSLYSNPIPQGFSPNFEITGALQKYMTVSLMATIVIHISETHKSEDLIHDLFAGGLSGPPVISDAAIYLFTTLMQENEGHPMASQEGKRDKILAWMNTSWSLCKSILKAFSRSFRLTKIGASYTDRTNMDRLAVHARPALLVNLLLTCANYPSSFVIHSSMPLATALIEALHIKERNQDLIQYVLRGVSQKLPSPKNQEVSTPTDYTLGGRTWDILVVNLLHQKVTSFSELWKSAVAQRSSYANQDLIRFVAVVSLTAFIVGHFVNASTVSETLIQAAHSLWVQLNDDINAMDISIKSTARETLLSMLCDIDALTERAQCSLHETLVKMMAIEASVLNDIAAQYTTDDQDDDPMELEDSTRSERRRGDEPALFSTSRFDLPFPSAPAQYASGQWLHLKLLHSFRLAGESLEVNDPDRLIKALLDSPLEILLTARPSVIYALNHCRSISRSIACALLKYLGEKCLQEYSWERSEAALCFCLEVMETFTPLWAIDEDDELYDVAYDIYSWVLDIGLSKSRVSDRVYLRISRMLGTVLNINSGFAKGDSEPSPRTHLLLLLRTGNNVMRFYSTPVILELFSHFVLSQHDRIFNDVIEHLPTDPDCVEGIKLRLFILTELACKWHTLLRRSMYHLFETPALIPTCTHHAHCCIVKICENLHVEDPQHLFVLFAPQILYTWLSDQKIDSIPFKIFEYRELSYLLSDVKNEVVAQAIMRDEVSTIDDISSHLREDPESLIIVSFPRVEAYCIARDIGMPRSQAGNSRSVESSLKKRLGSSTFSELMQTNFPLIIAMLILSMDTEDSFDKAVQRHPSSDYVENVSRILQTLGDIPPSATSTQQPSFRTKYVLDEITFACKRAQLDVATIWTPALLVYVVREIFGAIVPALGPFHTCGMIRRLRLVLALAGPTALTGYPLEMLLQAMRPFIVDFHCSEDAISIFRYLMQESKPYLQKHPSYFTGSILGTFASLLHFLDSKQDSTTQESHFRATLSNAQHFQSWLTAYAETYRPDIMSTTSWDTFKKLIFAASRMRLKGLAIKGSHEGNVVSGLLQDMKKGGRLLPLSTSEQVLMILSDAVEMPISIDDDMLQNDNEVLDAATVLLGSMSHLKLAPSFCHWIAKTVGRAFAATGKIIMPITYEKSNLKALPEGGTHSSQHILKTLNNLLFSSSLEHSGMAERTLQNLVSKLHGDEKKNTILDGLDVSISDALDWDPYICPPPPKPKPHPKSITDFSIRDANQTLENWASSFAVTLCLHSHHEPLLRCLTYILSEYKPLAVETFPYVIHTALIYWAETSMTTQRTELSEVFRVILGSKVKPDTPLIRLVLETIIYLRGQKMLGESTIADREKWLDIDFSDAANAAILCYMWEAALLLVEIHLSHTTKSSRSRRSSVNQIDEQMKSLHAIFENLQDPDSFYGITQQSSLASITSRLKFENEGFKSLSFQSAIFDAQMRLDSSPEPNDSSGLLESLNAANLQGLAYYLTTRSDSALVTANSQATYQAALSLRQWDLQPQKRGEGEGQYVFDILQRANQTGGLPGVKASLEPTLTACLRSLLNPQNSGKFKSRIVELAALTELSDILSQTTTGEMEVLWQRMKVRTGWMHTERIGLSKLLLDVREAVFATLSRRPSLAHALNISQNRALLYEIQNIRETMKIWNTHGALQGALNSAAYLSTLSNRLVVSGVDVVASAQLDLARVLWSHGEMASSIQVLRHVATRNDLHKQALPISRLEVLAEMGHHIAEARLEKPEEIQNKYLLPAIREIKNSPNGTVTGRVYHEFATFCDKQLQNPDDWDDFTRIEKLRTRKEKEVQDLEKMIKRAEGKQRDALKIHRTKAKQWFDLDDREYQRLKKIREGFIEKSLSNYLLALRACDAYDNDALRFVTLWLDQSANVMANSAVEAYIKQVPSRKFAPLMNQLSSRLLNEEADAFQRILFDLTVRICSEHPYHGMYQIFASSKSKGGRDEVALSRHAAANRVTEKLRETRAAGTLWIAIHNANISFVRFAVDRPDESKLRSGSKIQLSKIPSGGRMEQEIANSTTKIPPPIMKISLRADCDYSDMPRLVRFEPHVSIAGGVSAPKIVTMIASDGSRHKALFKGGNDDLRQDAIMEQVFEQVSNLLQGHRATRQRNLDIRTYKVLPLTANAGIIEFVQNTIPLHDYLLPAHQKYHPKDMKPSQCRKYIADAQNRSVETRVSTFKKVTDQFQPVMHYFFMERFIDPSDWFQKRLAYSRSTAAISILGHVLGLGDRHGHNILLDQQTGEVVHIDLGVAFEAGRVLPVPEVVPFRLTRDLVDGMGITGTEGVFRRCCNFTLEALRTDSDSIMTILDVLRYDPLYSWSVSPLRIKRMQESQQQAEAEDAAAQPPQQSIDPLASVTLNPKKDKDNINEPSEADRALTVVAKKLGKSLSVEATVNELIQAATDERNLAVLYCGWAAYA